MKQIMTFDHYSEQAAKTAVFKEEYKLTYPALGLTGEAGEVAEKVKKILRDKNGYLSDSDRQEIAKELGDVLWYVAALSNTIGIPMGEIAQMNIDKLASRQQRGVINGNGDNR